MTKPSWVQTIQLCASVSFFDMPWRAYDGRSDYDNGPIGHGMTEGHAITNLLDQMRAAIAERAETGLEGHFWAFDPERGPEDHIRGTGETPEAAIADLAARILEADG